MLRTVYAFLLASSVALHGQPAAAPQFEVASIRPSNPDEMHGGSGCPTGNGRLTFNNVTLKRCIMGAYGIGPNQIIGGPAWIDADRFEIVAKSDKPDGTGLLDAMFRTLLADRFKLVLHRETRPLQAYVVDIAKNGPKLEKAVTGGAKTSSGRGLIDAQVITMSRFAEVLSRQMDLPVVDRTNLDGAFNLKLEWNSDTTRPEAGPSIFTAIQEQLGLRLQSQKVPLEVLVIDHAERPSAN